MPRSATDATRFTSTTPHASTKPPAAGKIPSPNASRSGRPGPTGETPQQKVARLRAAAAKARDAKFTTFDKVLVHGRVWADRAHRFATLSLIGITFICGGVTVYALGDMMIYNRQKRTEFFAQEKAIHQAAISKAKLAIAEGVASEDQIAFINREEEHERQIAERKNKPGVWKRSKNWLFSDLKKDEDIENAESSEKSWGADGTDKENAWKGIRESNILKAVDEKKEAAQSKVQGAIETERERQRSGGPLDRIGTSADEEQPKAGGWTSFMNIKR